METLFNRIKLLSNERFTLPYCNCLWIEDELNCLVDSSPPANEMENIRGFRVDMIVNSHGHADHCSRNHEFPKARVFLHPTEHERVVSGEAYLEAWGFYKFNETEVRPHYLDAVHWHARAADESLADGQLISTGVVEFKVLHLPGHSIGHCGFLFPKEGFVFTADINLDSFGPWYATIDSGVQDFLDTLERLSRLNLDMLVTGHGRAVITGNISRRLADYRDIIFAREEKIVRHLYSGKHTVAEIAAEKPVFGRFPEPMSVYFLHESVMVWNHLERLVALGKAEKSGDRYYLVSGVAPHNLYLG